MSTAMAIQLVVGAVQIVVSAVLAVYVARKAAQTAISAAQISAASSDKDRLSAARATWFEEYRHALDMVLLEDPQRPKATAAGLARLNHLMDSDLATDEDRELIRVTLHSVIPQLELADSPPAAVREDDSA